MPLFNSPTSLSPATNQSNIVVEWLRSEEPPERPRAPTDLICLSPSVFQQHVAICHSLSSHLVLSRRSPSCRLETVATKSPPGRPIGRRQKRRSGQHRRALPSTDRHRVGTLPPALDHLVLLFLCALFFRFLSSVSFTSQHHTPPPVSTLSTILQRAHIGRRTLVPSFSTVPIQSACLLARHPENLTI